MENEIYTTAGCARCKITKRFMQEKGIPYQEYDFKGEGKDQFARFYRANRDAIYRDQDGVEFPVFHDGREVRQGVGIILGYLLAGDQLDGFIGRSRLHGEWIDGFDISGGDPAQVDPLLDVLSYLKKNGLKVEVVTSGRNASVLAAVTQKGLCDRLIMEVKGPAALYERLEGRPLDDEELKQSIRLAATVPEYRFYTTVAPLEREDGGIDWLSPEEIGQTAQLIEEATGSKKHPYQLRAFDPKTAEDERFQSLEPLPASAMFKYRTAARRYQVMTEIAK